MAVCSSGCGCLAFSSSYNCSPNTPIRQLLRVGSLVVKGLSNPAPDPGSEASGANVVLAGRVPGVGRVGVGGEVVDVVVAAGAPVVVADAAVVVLGATGGVKEVDAAVAAVVAGAAVVTGEAASEPPPHAEASTAMVRKTAIARIGRVCHNAGCAGGVMA
ncbi:MAG: hypothetical protein HN359_02400 [Actinobacteria bacterium]|jgi:hypothetical protein|nr:hypothetical protein [Actinomycetota bacterium]